MNDFMERMKHIPPWGYALIAVGVLFLSYMVSKNKSSAGTVTQTIAPVDPSAETAANDSLNRMQDMYNQLSAKYDNSIQKEATMSAGIDYLNQQIKDLKGATPPTPTAHTSSHTVYQAETGVYTNLADANKAMQWVRTNVGDHVSIISGKGQYRVIAETPSAQAGQDIVNGLQKAHLTNVGYVVPKGA